MRKDKDYWTPLYNEFCRRYPDLAEDILDWYPSAQYEITIKLTGDRRYAFNMSGGLYLIYDGEENLNISDDEWKRIFSRKLYDRMCIIHITQEQLAEEIGVSQVMVSKYMNGKAIPSCTTLRRIARALRCSTSELMNYEM